MATPDVVDPIAVDSPSPSRVVLRSRMSLGHVVMIIAGLLAVVLNLSVLRSRDATYPVLLAESDLIAGSTVTQSDFRISLVSVDPALLERVMTEADLGAAVGSVTTRDIPAGGLLVRDDLAAPAAPRELRAMSIPIRPSHAAGGTISVGDRVDVIWVSDAGARFILAGAEVLGVASQASGALSAPRDYFITVAVDAQGALSLARALSEGDIDVLRSTGAPHLPADAVPAATEAGR